jgi:hypothetical protein
MGSKGEMKGRRLSQMPQDRLKGNIMTLSIGGGRKKAETVFINSEVGY